MSVCHHILKVCEHDILQTAVEISPNLRPRCNDGTCDVWLYLRLSFSLVILNTPQSAVIMNS